jgi:hypothetical protein
MSLSTTLRFEGEYAAIPERMRGGIIRWVEEGLPPGNFLSAIIRNDLSWTLAAADAENRELIPLYVRWFHWEAPAACHGSSEAAKAWEAQGGLKKRQATAE